MGRITVELLRRRAEHNEGCLSNLKEITLHQQDIEKIEVVGDTCRELEILYLCNNYISRIEGLHHLKCLKYLNLAVNNITCIEGLEGCEALERLDLTLNFVKDMTCVRRLQANAFLDQLHLTGNPCTKVEGYRAYVIHALPQLRDLDGEEVVRSERIEARQCKSDVAAVVDEEALRVRENERIKAEMIQQGIEVFPPRYNEKGERVYGHTPEERLQMLREKEEEEARRQKKLQEERETSRLASLNAELNKPPQRLSAEEEIAKYGRLLLRNEPKLPIRLDEESNEEAVILTVGVPKFLSTTLIDLQIEVDYIRVVVKGKLIQVPLQREIAPSAAKVQRSVVTGELNVTVPYAPHVLQEIAEAKKRRQRLRGIWTDEECNDVAE
ncbi:putative leucine-rich repeat protein [Trypanosoma rangeli]|uniref:Putative leucine-rich repeat protein n=1 Tax=Trypanosoma rangeli TaxID=5698 RepID=A0A3R7LV56_TRYRA|nr:putative leucine-rich repeat protein [Trypanosoma rangeli]RNF03892.1 putative leucine-rich repeat protein [Trypanosoma rangeli]|eukprot:RNF03892.1 putative leucine-rich repeat protein [Trypanosoma rangeli]